MGCAQQQPWRMIARPRSTTTTTTTGFAAVDSILLRSLRDHYQEVAKMTPPPKVSPPSHFTIVKGALDNHGPVLKRTFGSEQISIYVTRLGNIIRGGDDDDDDDDDGINQLFLHVEMSKPGQKNSLLFLCGLYPDALGIHSVSMRPKLESQGLLIVPAQYTGPSFQDLDERMRDALHSYIEERGVNESLFPFLQAWLYVKDNRNLMRWFRQVGQYISEQNQAKST